jgi:hypothetical protein
VRWFIPAITSASSSTTRGSNANGVKCGMQLPVKRLANVEARHRTNPTREATRCPSRGARDIRPSAARRSRRFLGQAIPARLFANTAARKRHGGPCETGKPDTASAATACTTRNERVERRSTRRGGR